MNNTLRNQDWVLARFREDESRFDPPFYATSLIMGRIFMWLSINRNVDWYGVEMADGSLSCLRPIYVWPPYPGEPPEEKAVVNKMRYVGEMQRRKIERIMKNVSGLFMRHDVQEGYFKI